MLFKIDLQIDSVIDNYVVWHNPKNKILPWPFSAAVFVSFKETLVQYIMKQRVTV